MLRLLGLTEPTSSTQSWSVRLAVGNLRSELLSKPNVDVSCCYLNLAMFDERAAMRIGEVAKRAGVSVRSLRYYEEQGLLASTRSARGQRLYGDEEVERVTFIQRLYSAGLSSRTIAELLPCVVSPSADNSDAALERLYEERDRISAYITDLGRTRIALDALIDANGAHRQLTVSG